jgi:hypothetical protein
MRQFRHPSFRQLFSRQGYLAEYLLISALGLGACADESEYAEDSGFADPDDPDGPQENQLRWAPARGISILEIEANQGTRVALTNDEGEWLGPKSRNMKLVSDRDTLLRVHWTVADGWRPHEVKARLILDVGDGQPIVREQTRMIEDDSARTSLNRTFFFGLVAEAGETAPGTRLRVELYEPDVEQNTTLEKAIQTAPIEGSQPIGFETDPMHMKVVLVPIHYTGEGKDLMPNLDEPTVKTLIDALYEENPVQEIQYQVRGHIGYDDTMVNLGALLPLMSAVKAKDGGDPNLYYHAFIDIGCPVVGCGNYGVAGIAQMAGPSQNASLSRVAASVFWRDNYGTVVRTADTFVHEVGHNQGLAHVACPGVNAAGPDPNYPYDDGKIGQWGFGIRSFSLHNPTASHDYMSYCGNAWGSDWTFNKTYERIRTLTSWDLGAAEGKAPEDSEWTMGEELVIGALYPDGTEQWFTLPGGIDVEEIVPDELLAFEIDGQEFEQPTVLRTLSDGETQWVVAPLPEGTDIGAVEQVKHVRRGEVRRVIPRAEIVTDLVGGTEVTF